MNDINAFERLVADVADDLMGPSRSFDPAAIVQSARTMAPRSRWTRLTQRIPGDRFVPAEGGFSMFSALKFLAAGVIVALFGGFLLTGILTTQQGDEVLPAAVTASPTAEVTSEPTESPDPSVRTDILPGVTLSIEEVEPGVSRVVDDGVRDLAKANNLDIVAGHDGGIWLLRPKRFFRLGGDEWHAWPHEKPEIQDFEVAPDGTVWALSSGGAAEGLWSVGRGSDDWTLTTGGVPNDMWVTSDGTVWGLNGRTIGYLGADGWQSVGEDVASDSWVFLGDVVVSDRGEVWAIGWAAGLRSREMQHLVDGTWRTYEGLDDLQWRAGGAQDSAIGADGTLWGATKRGALFRFDGTEWMTFGPPDWMLPDWMPTDLEGWTLVEDEWVPVSMAELRAWHEEYPDRESHYPEQDLWPSLLWGELHVAADGSVWVAARLGEQWWGVSWWQDDSAVFDRPICERGIDGVAHFDGVTWSRFLQGHCIESMDIAADGSVWLLAAESGARTDQPFIRTQTYVITPESIAAAG